MLGCSDDLISCRQLHSSSLSAPAADLAPLAHRDQREELLPASCAPHSSCPARESLSRLRYYLVGMCADEQHLQDQKVAVPSASELYDL